MTRRVYPTPMKSRGRAGARPLVVLMEGMRRGGLAAATLVVLTLLAWGCAGHPRAFTLDWEVSDKADGPAVNGRIYNPYSLPARHIKLLVEGLDESGVVVNRTLGVIESIVRSGESLRFSVPVPSAPQYRVSVLSWDLQTPGSSGSGRR